MPAEEYQALLLCQLLDLILRKYSALRRHIYHPWLCLVLFHYRHNAIVDGLCLHYHACAAAVGLIVNTAVLVFGIVTDIVRVDLNVAVFDTSADYAFAENSVAHGREQRCNINPHYLRPQTDREADV